MSAAPVAAYPVMFVDVAADGSSRIPTHPRVEWLRATDRDSANGSTVERPGMASTDITPLQPFQLHGGNILVLGDVRSPSP